MVSWGSRESVNVGWALGNATRLEFKNLLNAKVEEFGLC